jgi:hypothetical protein
MNPFDETNNGNPENPTISAIDPDKDYTEELVGEGKKFATVTDLARGKVEADSFIERLKNENAELRARQTEAIRMEEFLEQIKNQTPSNSNSNGDTPVTPDISASDTQNSDAGSQNDDAVLRKEDIDSIVAAKLQEAQTNASRQQNLDRVSQAMRDKFGDNTSQAVQQLAAATNLTPKQLESLSMESPQVVISLLNAGEDTTPQRQQTSLFTDRTPHSTNPASVPSVVRTKASDGFRDQAYYDELQRTDPKRYQSQEVQSERHAMALRDADRFFGS